VTDVSFVSATHGWLIGTTACGRAKRCSRVERTTDGGASWHVLATVPPGNPFGIRFATDTVGYAYGGVDPQGAASLIEVTHDSGASWGPVSAPTGPGSPQAYALEVDAGQVWALDGVQYAAVDRGAIGGSSLTQVGTGGNRGDELAVQGSEGYVLGLHGAGPVAPILEVFAAGGMAERTLPKACTTGAPVADAAALSPLVTAGHLVVACITAQGNGSVSALSTSADDGRTWQPLATLPSCAVSSLTGTTTAVFAACGFGGLEKVALLGGAATTSLTGSDFNYVGFTDDRDGVAISAAGPSDPTAQQHLFLTRDGGAHWTRVRS